MDDLRPGERFAGCRIEAVAGRGGMGVVYRATELALSRRVALKVVAPESVADTDFTRRFGREVRMAASIDHPNIVPVYGTGEEDGRLYLVMRYVDGTDLQALVRRAGRLEPARAAAIVAQVAAGLDAAHAAGLVHRDVKPANVLLTLAGTSGADHVYLTDFGLTVEISSGTRMTTTGHWIGSVDYMAPEQLRAEALDARTDVYALGGVLHAALTGEAPFSRGTVPQTIAAHLGDPPPRPTALAPVDPAFDAVVARALAKDPADRYRSAGDLGRAAQAAARGERITTGERVVARGAAAPSDDPTTRLPPLAPTEVVGVKVSPAASRPPGSGGDRAAPAEDDGVASAPEDDRAVPVPQDGAAAPEDDRAAPAREGGRAVPAPEGARPAPDRDRATPAPAGERSAAAPDRDRATPAPGGERAASKPGKRRLTPSPARPRAAPLPADRAARPAIAPAGHAPARDLARSGARAAPAGGDAAGEPGVRRHRSRSRILGGLAALTALAVAGVLAGLLVNSGGGPRAVSASLAADEIRAAARDFAAAYGDEDADALRATLARNAQRVAPDGAQRGRGDVLAVYRRQFAAADVQAYDLDDVDVVAGAAGRAAGRYTVTRSGRDDITGRVAFGVVREDGEPRIALIATQPDP